MKILIFSDSHGFCEPMRRVMRMHPDCDAVFFLGDGVSDLDLLAEEFPGVTYLCVKGNNDLGAVFRGLPVEKTERITLAGRRIVLTHGDLYGAHSGLDGLSRLADAQKADILLFGHTHAPFEHRESGEKPVIYFNPGAILPRDGFSSFGILTLDEQNILFSHGSLSVYQ